MIAGTDTSNTVLTWTISSILRNPSVLEKVKAELDIHVGKEEKVKAELDIHVGKERSVCESDISKLTYLHAIVKETKIISSCSSFSTS